MHRKMGQIDGDAGNLNQSKVVDQLFEIKTLFYIGAYQQCLNEIDRLIKINSSEKECFMWRCYLAQHKYRVVLDGTAQVNETKQFDLFAVRKLAEYFVSIQTNGGAGLSSSSSSSSEKRQSIIKYFDGKYFDGNDQKNPTTISSLSGGGGGGSANGLIDLADQQQTMGRIIAATIYYNEGLYENALSVLNGQFDLESLSIQIQCQLKMNRIDLAKKTIVIMQSIDDDATLTQLASAWIHIEIGGDKLQDAYFVFQDFCDKFSMTCTLLNGQAVCYIGQEKYEEAEAVLRDCLDRDSNNYDTLINLIVLAQLQPTTMAGSGQSAAVTSSAVSSSASASSISGGDTINRYVSQLNESHKQSSIIQEIDGKKLDFQRLCLKYEPSKSLASI